MQQALCRECLKALGQLYKHGTAIVDGAECLAQPTGKALVPSPGLWVEPSATVWQHILCAMPHHALFHSIHTGTPRNQGY